MMGPSHYGKPHAAHIGSMLSSWAHIGFHMDPPQGPYGPHMVKAATQSEKSVVVKFAWQFKLSILTH